MVEIEIQAALAALESEAGLLVEANFASRADARDELEFHILDRLDGLLAAEPSAALSQLHQQALALRRRFVAVDQQLFQRLRSAIRAGQFTPESLRAQLATYAGPVWETNTAAATEYDTLDELTNGLFMKPAQPLEQQAREPEMVYYQKTPARIIVALAAKITPQDTFYDLGSGLGQVPMLVQLLSGATAKGVEIEPSYCRHAKACAEALGLKRVHFLNTDARSLTYADGTVFFLYTPFTGHILKQVLAQLQRVAQDKPIRLFSFGPGTRPLVEQPWLRQVGSLGTNVYQLAEFQSC